MPIQAATFISKTDNLVVLEFNLYVKETRFCNRPSTSPARGWGKIFFSEKYCPRLKNIYFKCRMCFIIEKCY